MVQHGASFRSVLGLVSTGQLEDVFEALRSLNLAVDLPEILLAFESKTLVIWVILVSSTEGLEFRNQQEKCDGRREDICLHAIIFQALSVAADVMASLTQLSKSLLDLPKLRSVVSE